MRWIVESITFRDALIWRKLGGHRAIRKIDRVDADSSTARIEDAVDFKSSIVEIVKDDIDSTILLGRDGLTKEVY